MSASLWFAQFARQAHTAALGLGDLPERRGHATSTRTTNRHHQAFLIAWGALTMSAAGLLKAHYSGASPEALHYVLTPTATLVGALSGHPFTVEPGIGYTSRDALLTITKACAGVNFLIIAGLLLCTLWTPARLTPGNLLSLQILAWAVAYLCTIAVNSVRVLIALAIHGPHRWEGTLLYFGALLALGRLALRLRDKAATALLGLIPTAWLLYIGVTLGIPVVRGAFQGPDAATFVAHSQVVLGVTGAVAAASWLGQRRASVALSEQTSVTPRRGYGQ